MYSEEAKQVILTKTKAKSQGENQFIGYCPSHDDKNPSLSIKFDGEKTILHCHSGCSYKDIRFNLGLSSTPINNNAVLKLLSDAKPFRRKRNDGYKYLKKRGVPIIPPGDEVYYHSELTYHHNSGSITSHPALLFRIRNNKDETIGVQRVYLNNSGGKANVSSPKKVKGKFSGGAIKLGIVSDEIHLCEGPETALALYKALERPIWACVSATNISAQVIPKTVSKVHIWADKDKSRTGEREANKAAVKYTENGLEVYVHMPPSEVLENSKSVDWLDEYNINAVAIKNSYINTALYGWGKLEEFRLLEVLEAPSTREKRKLRRAKFQESKCLTAPTRSDDFSRY